MDTVVKLLMNILSRKFEIRSRRIRSPSWLSARACKELDQTTDTKPEYNGR